MLELGANGYYSVSGFAPASASARQNRNAEFAENPAENAEKNRARSTSVVIVGRVFRWLFLFWLGTSTETCLPIFLDRGRELVHVGEEHGDLPHVVGA